jgi:hypothetical protein
MENIPFLPLVFANIGLAATNLSNILHHKSGSTLFQRSICSLHFIFYGLWFTIFWIFSTDFTDMLFFYDAQISLNDVASGIIFDWRIVTWAISYTTNLVPPYFKDQSVHYISYSYALPIAPNIINYQRVFQDFTIDYLKPNLPTVLATILQSNIIPLATSLREMEEMVYFPFHSHVSSPAWKSCVDQYPLVYKSDCTK